MADFEGEEFRYFPSLAIEANSGELAEFEGGGSAEGRGVVWVVENEVS